MKIILTIFSLKFLFSLLKEKAPIVFPFQIGLKIGKGGSGGIYEILTENSDREKKLVIKLFPSSHKKFFEHEKAILKRVKQINDQFFLQYIQDYTPSKYIVFKQIFYLLIYSLGQPNLETKQFGIWNHIRKRSL